MAMSSSRCALTPHADSLKLIPEEVSKMVMIQAGSPAVSQSSQTASPPEAGPVFVPPRRPSAFARRLLQESTAEGHADDAVTAYDELWFAGRPTV
jgi:hypothetical protein